MNVTEEPPPLARRPIVGSATALTEEINDSWRLLLGCLGAAGVVTVVLYLLTVVTG